jgi:L-alanine-DL-glutamate epimerase-like enolase superfamily enzyme
MSNRSVSRRSFLNASAMGAVSGAAGMMIHPGAVAAQEVGVKPSDLPDLTIKEVKVYVANIDGVRKLNSTENGWIFSMVTNSGIEGNYTDGNRGLTPNWLEYAKATCVGKSVLDLLPMIPSSASFGSGRGGRGRGGGATDGRGAATQPAAAAAGTPGSRGRGGGGGGRGGGGGGGGGRGGAFVGGFGFGRGRQSTNSGGVDLAAAYVDVMLWDILGKAVNRPIYKLLGGTKDRMLAYSSGQHLATVEDFAPNALAAKNEGFKAYKIHPGGGQHRNGGNIPAYLGHIDEIKEVRKACGDDFTLLFDPVQRYNVFEALKVGRVLDEYGYVSFEDPIPSTDLDGLIELRSKLDVPIEVGEFLYSVYDFAEYIRRGGMDIVRLIADNVGGISGSYRIAQLADAFGMPCTPHNWGNAMDLALHFHIELAMPNCYWFEMPNTADLTDRAYIKEKFRIDQNGYVLAPTKPGLGYPVDHDALDKIMIRVDR